MPSILENLKKTFASFIVEKDKEPCLHCRVSPDSLKILREKGGEKNRDETISQGSKEEMRCQ